MRCAALVTLHHGDLLEQGTLRAVIDATKPDEIYHLAAPAFVPDSWPLAAATMQAIATLTGELIDAVRDHVPRARVVVATSREIFGSGAPEPAARGHAVRAELCPTASPSSPRTSWSGCCAPTTGCICARRSSSTTSPRAAIRSSSRAR